MEGRSKNDVGASLSKSSKLHFDYNPVIRQYNKEVSNF